MAEQFKAGGVYIREAKDLGSLHPLKTDIQVDFSTDFVDLYIGKGTLETHVRWDRKTGKVSQ